MKRNSTLTIVAALVAIAVLATAGVLFTTGDAAMERLALLMAVFGTIIPGLVASLRADQAAQQTNGNLDRRIREGVQDAMQARRTTDQVVIHESPTQPSVIEGDGQRAGDPAPDPGVG